MNEVWDVSEEVVRHVAEVARINLSEEEIKKYADELKAVLGSFSKIKEVNVEGVEPSFQPVEVKNVFREDVVKEGVEREKGMANTNNKEEGYFKGPKAIE